MTGRRKLSKKRINQRHQWHKSHKSHQCSGTRWDRWQRAKKQIVGRTLKMMTIRMRKVMMLRPVREMVKRTGDNLKTP